MVACRYEANAPQLNVLEAVDAYTVGIDRPACVPSPFSPSLSDSPGACLLSAPVLLLWGYM